LPNDTFALPTWSPNSSLLAYYSSASGSLQLWIYDLRDRGTRQISFVRAGINPPVAVYLGGSGRTELRYGWSPDNAKIVFANQVAIPRIATAEALKFPTAEELKEGHPIVLTN